MKTDIYNHTGKVAGSIDLPENVFGLQWNADLVHQVVVGMQSNARANTAHTKDRSEVRGGGRKPWRQKGTGQARHGSKRSPIWRGGGITFGPRAERNYDKKINKKMRSKALLVALSQKLRDGQIIFTEGFEGSSSKTADLQKTLTAFEGIKGFETLNTKKHNNVFMTAVEPTDELKRAGSNIYHTTVADVANLNVVDVLNHRYLVITDPEKSVEFLSSKVTNK
jgi:large subunit ribosomal protein L4